MTRIEADLARVMAARGDTAYAVETSPYPAVRILPGLLRGPDD